MKGDTAHSLSNQIYMFNLGPFLLTKVNTNVADYIDLTKLNNADYNAGNDGKATFTSTKADAKKALRIYNALKPAAKNEFDKYSGINDYASPEVGDSFVIASESEMPEFNPGRRAWQFHWGGVIMKEGHDIVTLESESSGDASDIDTEWHIEMSGVKHALNTDVKGKSFNKIHQESGLHGNKTSTLAIKNVLTPTEARNFAKEDYPSQFEGWLGSLADDHDNSEENRTNWDLHYGARLGQLNNFLDSNKLKEFQKVVLREIKVELEEIKIRRDNIGNNEEVQGLDNQVQDDSDTDYDSEDNAILNDLDI